MTVVSLASGGEVLCMLAQVLLNPDMPCLSNSVDLDLHCLSLSM